MDTVTQVLEHPKYKACCETITACLASETCKWKAEERIDRPYFEIKEDYDIRKRGLL